jgi:YVTN family beta-propeller protein
MKCLRKAALGVFLIAGAYPGWAQNSLVVVVNAGDSTASIFSTGNQIPGGDPSLKLEKVLPTGKAPNEVCLSPDGKRAYVANRGDISITVLDLDNKTVASTITDPAMKNPDGCVISKDGAKLYVAAAGAEAVFVFSTGDGHKLTQIKVGNEPRRLLFSADGSQLYVSNGEERYVSVVDLKTNKEVGRIKAGRDPRALALMPDGKYLAIANVSDDTVEFVRLGSSEPEFVVGVPKSPQRLVVVPSKELLFSIGRFDGVVSILDIRANKEYGRLITTLPVGRGPWGMTLSAAGDCVYVTNTRDNTITLIDLRMMRPGLTLPTGQGPMGVAVR